jgi:tetratricopeptide (TPR) repeat protein
LGSDVGKAKASGWSWWLFPMLLLATLVAYYPVWHGGLLWDDDQHLTREALRSIDGLWRIWFDIGATQQYYPITHSAFWLEYRLWANHTFGYHIVNVGLHACSAYLVAAILRRLAVPGAVVAALIFALHPVHVESVAWIAELKNTLSGVFFLSAALAYVHFDQRRETRLYVSALALFVLALLSKSVTATLPAALVVIVWWRRGTIDRRRDLWPLIPFVAAGAAAGLLTAWVEKTMIGARGAEFEFSFVERCVIAGRVIWFYLHTLVWPSNLMFNYPRWTISGGEWWQYVDLLAVLAVAGVLWWRRARGPLAALLVFCALLFPVLGFFNVYPFRFSFVADHFAYLASIPIIALAAAGLDSCARRWRLTPPVTAVAVLALSGALGFLTFRQSRHYTDAETLYLDLLARNPSSWLAHANLGTLMLNTRPGEALAHLDKALQLEPDLAEARNDRGTALQRTGRLDEAVAEYREAIRLVPDFATAHNNLANALLALGRHEEAIAAGREALRLRPDFLEAHYSVALALLALGRREEALVHFGEAVRLKPDFADAHENLARLLQEMGRFAEALPHHEAALRFAPDSAVVHNNVGAALRQAGRADEALIHFMEAVRLQPDYADAQFNLANTLQSQGRIQESVPHYLVVLKINPSDGAAHTNLGAAFEALGQRGDAAAHYREALRLNPGSHQARDNLVRVAGR